MAIGLIPPIKPIPATNGFMLPTLPRYLFIRPAPIASHPAETNLKVVISAPRRPFLFLMFLLTYRSAIRHRQSDYPIPQAAFARFTAILLQARSHAPVMCR